MKQSLCRGRLRHRTGFTLIELLVVVVIIGILASVALPSFVGAQDKARNAAVGSNIHSVKLALEQYASDYEGSYPEPAAVLVNAGGGGGGHHRPRGTTAPLDGLEDYLPGEVLPKSPWSNTAQTTFVIQNSSRGGINLTDAKEVSEQGKTLSAPGTMIGAGAVASGMPNSISDYGAISYSYHTAAQVYTLYGTGKNGSNAIVGGAASNGGQ